MHCHVVVAGLFRPAAAGADPYRELDLPALETLLARGRRTPLAGASLERWLAGTYGVAEGDRLPLAPFALRGEGVDPGDDWWLAADPVHLEVRGDRLILADASRLGIAPEEARELVSACNAHFAPEGLAFIAPHPQRWYVRAPGAPGIGTVPTSEVAGRGIEGFLPAGEGGARWRRIFTEAQMLLYRHPANARREASAEPTVNSLWFWGAGRGHRAPGRAPYIAVWSDHPLAAGLAAVGGAQHRPLPGSCAPLLAALRDGHGAHLVVLSPPGGAHADAAAWRAALAALERDWIAPLFEAASSGALERVVLSALGPRAGIRAEFARAHRFRFWRRRRALAGYAA